MYDNNSVLMKNELLFKLIKRYILLKIISLSIYMIYPNSGKKLFTIYLLGGNW